VHKYTPTAAVPGNISNVLIIGSRGAVRVTVHPASKHWRFAERERICKGAFPRLELAG
jgi:hypothetical protein